MPTSVEGEKSLGRKAREIVGLDGFLGFEICEGPLPATDDFVRVPMPVLATGPAGRLKNCFFQCGIL